MLIKEIAAEDQKRRRKRKKIILLITALYLSSKGMTCAFCITEKERKYDNVN